MTIEFNKEEMLLTVLGKLKNNPLKGLLIELVESKEVSEIVVNNNKIFVTKLLENKLHSGAYEVIWEGNKQDTYNLIKELADILNFNEKFNKNEYQEGLLLITNQEPIAGYELTIRKYLEFLNK